jgi:hypothetical protein
MEELPVEVLPIKIAAISLGVNLCAVFASVGSFLQSPSCRRALANHRRAIALPQRDQDSRLWNEGASREAGHAIGNPPNASRRLHHCPRGALPEQVSLLVAC